MGLTFDEFGMWLHLGGSYWQRASVDAIIVVAALFGLVAFGRSIKHFEARHFWAFIILLALIISFSVALYLAGNRIGNGTRRWKCWRRHRRRERQCRPSEDFSPAGQSKMFAVQCLRCMLWR